MLKHLLKANSRILDAYQYYADPATLQYYLNWRLVRSIGELQILTKVSYAVLLLVPALAAIWPSVRLLVNQHNRAIEEATIILERSDNSFSDSISQLEVLLEDKPMNDATRNKIEQALGRVESASNKFHDRVHVYLEDFTNRSLESPRLPLTLAYSFFAALLIAIGHFVYQAGAPEEVQRFTWDEFVASKKAEFQKHPSKESVENAKVDLRTRLAIRINESQGREYMRLLDKVNSATAEEKIEILEEMGSVKLRSLYSWIQAGRASIPNMPVLAKLIEQVLMSHTNEIAVFNPRDNRSFLPVVDTPSNLDMEIIEQAARAEYIVIASSVTVHFLALG